MDRWKEHSSYNDRHSPMRRQEQRAHRRKMVSRILLICGIFAALLLLYFLVIPADHTLLSLFGSKQTSPGEKPTDSMVTTQELSTEDPAIAAAREQETVLKNAQLLAAGYDYDGAIELIKDCDGYTESPALVDAIDSYEKSKESLVPYPVDQVTHIFYHSLIVDPSLAFDEPSEVSNYNQVMTTVEEFKKITQEMYDRGYVLVSIHDLGHIEKDKDGNEKMVRGEILLPKGKKAFVLSVDDVSYYHYMEGDGFASKIVIGEDGKPTCEYKNPDGSVVTGDYDVVPILDAFLEAHPDGAYRGARGILALTGYNGILGYRTSPIYDKDGANRDSAQQAFLDSHPDFDFEEECKQAKAVVKALKTDGWEFASHSYGHRYYGQISTKDFKADTKKWEEAVQPLVGDTDILIYAFGDDIGSWRNYSQDNERFKYLKKLGFDYFCNVDSSQYWVQFGNNYLRQGRRNLDGSRMWEALSGGKDRLSDLFDVKEVFDSARPTPVQ